MSTYLDNLADGKGNPLLEGLLAKARAQGSVTVSEIADYIKASANSADNLHRIGTDGLPHTTNVVALYTGNLNEGSSSARVGNIATDMSLRSSDVVALDTTATGRLLIKLNQLANGAADPDGIFSTLVGNGDINQFKIDFGRASNDIFKDASKALIQHNGGRIIALVGEGADPSGILADTELRSVLEDYRAKYTGINGVAISDFEKLAYDKGVFKPQLALQSAAKLSADALRELGDAVTIHTRVDAGTGWVVETSVELDALTKERLGIADISFGSRASAYTSELNPGTFNFKDAHAKILATASTLEQAYKATANGMPPEYDSRAWTGQDVDFNKMVDQLSGTISNLAKGAAQLGLDTVASAYEKFEKLAIEGGGKIAASFEEISFSGQRWLKSFIDSVGDAVDHVSPGLANIWSSVKAHYAKNWDLAADAFRYDGNPAKYAVKLGTSVLALGLGALETAVIWKKHDGFTPAFFAEAGFKIGIALTFAPLAAKVAGALMASAPVWGTAAVITVFAAGTYYAVRTIAHDIVTEWGKDGETDSFMYKTAAYIVSWTDYIEGKVANVATQVVESVKGAPSELVTDAKQGVSNITIEKILTVDGDHAVYTYDEKNVWILASDGSAAFGGKESDWLFHRGYGQLFGDDGDDALFGLFAKILKAGQPIGEAPPAGKPDTRTIAEKDLYLTLDGGKGNDWVVTIGGEKAITIGGEGRDWIFNTSAGGIIFGDTENGLNEAGTAGELLRLDALGITEFNLTVAALNFVTPQRNSLLDKGSYSFASGGLAKAENDNFMLRKWAA